MLSLINPAFPSLFDDCSLSFVSKALTMFENSIFGGMLSSQVEKHLRGHRGQLPFPALYPLPVCGVSPHTSKHSQTSLGCSTIQLNFDTVYLDTASDPKDLWFGPIKLPPIKYQLPVQVVTCAPDQPAIEWRFQ